MTDEMRVQGKLGRSPGHTAVCDTLSLVWLMHTGIGPKLDDLKVVYGTGVW